jgi:predicted nuclease of predicted toxin-antitoxin system
VRLLLDHNIPASVAEVFVAHGHEVTKLADVLPVKSDDDDIAGFAEIEGFVLVSIDRDFRKIAPRIPTGRKKQFMRLSRISLTCFEPNAVARLEAAMSFIHLEYEVAQNSLDRRMIVEIGDRVIRTVR